MPKAKISTLKDAGATIAKPYFEIVEKVGEFGCLLNILK